MQKLALIFSLIVFMGFTSPENVQLYNLEGKLVHLNFKNSKATVILFLSPECPLCESYSLNIRNLLVQYTNKDIRFLAIIPGKEYSKEQVISFRNKYQLKDLTFWFDPKYNLCESLGATITPEVFVVNRTGQRLYSGRIDNWAYELGRKRKVITEHDLLNVLTAIQEGKSIKPYQTKAVGCFIK